MQTRRDFIKRMALAGVGVSAGAAVLAPEARAMVGKFNDPLPLTGWGVRASGPMTWEADDRSAVVVATITQGSVTGSGTVVVAAGRAEWSCSVFGAFRTGSADCHAIAISKHKDGSTESYEWSQTVTLR